MVDSDYEEENDIDEGEIDSELLFTDVIEAAVASSSQQVEPQHKKHYKTLEELMSGCNIESSKTFPTNNRPSVGNRINIRSTNRPLEAETTEDITMSKTQRLFVRWLSHVGLVDDIIDQYNETLKRIANRIKHTRLDLKNNKYATFTQVHMSPPKTWPHGSEAIDLTPAKCIEQKLDYYADIAADLVIVYVDPQTGKEVQLDKPIPMVKLGRIPVLVGSALCYTKIRRPSDHDLVNMGWCTVHPGCTYISNGVQRYIRMKETLRSSKIIRFRIKETCICQLTSHGTKGSNKITLEQSVQDTIRISVSGLTTKENAINVFQLYRLIVFAYEPSIAQKETPEDDCIMTDSQQDIDDVAFLNFDVSSILERVLIFVDEEHHDAVRTYLEVSFTELYGIGNDFVYIGKIKGQTEISYDVIRSECCRIVKSVVMSHIEDDESKEYNDKLNLLCLMVARYTTMRLGFDLENDRDSWAEKMVQSHEKIYQLFSAMFDNNPVGGKYTKATTTNKVVSKAAEFKDKKFPFTIDDVKLNIEPSVMECAFRNAFNKNQWRSKGGGDSVKEISSRFDPGQNVSGAVSLVTETTAMMRDDTKNVKVRRYCLSGYGFMCTKASEGKGCGIKKSRSVGCRISLERDSSFRYMYFVSYESYVEATESDEPVRFLSNTGPFPFNYTSEKCTVTDDDGVGYNFVTALMVHGRMMGWCHGESLREQLLKLRRCGKLPQDVSIVNDTYDNIFYFQCDSSRLIRPLLVVNMKTKKLVIDEIGGGKGWSLDIPTLFRRGAIEYIDTYEQQFSYVCKSLKHFEEVGGKEPFTHCEVDPSSILGTDTSLLSLPDHQAGTRNAYAACMEDGKLGVVSSGNQMSQFPTTGKRMKTANRGLVETITSKIIGSSRFPTGKNLRAAISTKDGFNQEDACVFNQSTIDNGAYDYEVEHTAVAIKRKPYKDKGAIVIEEFCKPDNKRKDPLIYRHLDKNGVAKLGSMIMLGDCIIGKVKKYTVDGKVIRVIDSSVYAKKGVVGLVDRVLLPTQVTEAIVQVRLYEMRSSVKGGKKARMSQKFTDAIYLPAEDMPRDLNGVPVDILIGPGALFRRKTCCLLIEMMMGMCAALNAKRYNVTAFTDIDYEEMNKTLVKNGFSTFCRQRLIDGTTGMLMEDDVFVGMVNIALLKHFTEDKYQCAGECPMQMVTHQPVQGRQRDGAQKLGEMEQLSNVSNGAAAIVHERSMVSSDGFVCVLCTTCGQFAYPDIVSGCHKCNFCGDKAEFGRVSLPWSFKLFTQVIGGLNIRTSIHTKPLVGLPFQEIY